MAVSTPQEACLSFIQDRISWLAPGRPGFTELHGLRRFLTDVCVEGWQKPRAIPFKLRLSTGQTTSKEINMPIIAWLLGVPITVILLLMLFGVF